MRTGKNKRDMSKNFDWAFNLNRLILNVIGVWPTSHKENDIGRSLRVPFICLWIFFCFFIPQMYALILVHRNLPLFVDNVITNCASFLSIAKLFFIWYNRREICKRCTPLNCCTSLLKLILTSSSWMIVDWANEKSSWEHEVMVKQARRGRLFTMSGYAIMFANMNFFIASPFFNLSIRIVNNITDLDEKRFFPLQTFYPYDFTRSPYFEITYLTQLIAIGFAGFSFSAADNFFGALVFHASGQCEILASRMTRLLNFTITSAETLESRKSKLILFKWKIQQVVEFHIHLIKFVFAIEKSFNLLILAHALGLSVIICCVGFGAIQSLKESPPIAQIFSLAASLINMLLHMFIYCIATETLTTNSTEFFREIYNCDWHLLPSKCARDIILIMIRSHFPLHLTAGKFFNLSLNAYIQVLKTSVGYISMLLAVS